MVGFRTCLRALVASAIPALLQALALSRSRAHDLDRQAGAPWPEARTVKPNIIWVMSDDLGYGEVGLYPAGSSHGRIATPNLDQFGREGMLFRNAYAGYSVCAPSRTTFFTGIHPGRFSHHGLDGLQVPKHGGLPNLAEMLQEAGYWTGAVGKISPLHKPLSQGFDRFVGQVDQMSCHNMYPKKIDEGNGKKNFPLTGNSNGHLGRDACMKNPDKYNYTMDVFHKYAMEWVHERATTAPDQPFFLYLAYTVPHAGGWRSVLQLGNPVPTNHFYSAEPWWNVEKDHASTITYMDQLFGELVQLLQTLDIDNKTIVFFASDNGAHNEGGHHHEFFNSTGGLRGQKRSLYEGGVRSPTMVRWPGYIQPGTTSDLRWAFWDVLPTMAEIVGHELPVFDEKVDGISIAPTLFAQFDRQVEHKYLYFTWDGGYSIIMGNLKGVVPECDVPMIPNLNDTMELYDLAADPFERHNLNDSVEIVARMKSMVMATVSDAHCFQCYYRSEWKDRWTEVGRAWPFPDWYMV